MRLRLQRVTSSQHKASFISMKAGPTNLIFKNNDSQWFFNQIINAFYVCKNSFVSRSMFNNSWIILSNSPWFCWIFWIIHPWTCIVRNANWKVAFHGTDICICNKCQFESGIRWKEHLHSQNMQIRTWPFMADIFAFTNH